MPAIARLLEDLARGADVEERCKFWFVRDTEGRLCFTLAFPLSPAQMEYVRMHMPEAMALSSQRGTLS